MAPANTSGDETGGVGVELPPGIYREPLVGTIISVVLTLLSLTTLAVFLTRRSIVIKSWSRLPFVVWLVFAIYTDSFVFVFATGILQFGFGVDSAYSICEAAILLCLVFYVTTKLIYLFLVEKAYIIRGNKKRRLKSKLYVFNSFGMIGLYIVVVILNFIFRISRMVDGQCVIGMKKVAMIPLISFDALVNVYLTMLFLIPLSGLYSFKNHQRTPANIRLRTVAIRTFIGALCTLASSIVNLTVLMSLDGEPGWVCLMCCNSDILFSAIVIHWVTSKDHAATGTKTGSSQYADDSTHPRSGAGHGPVPPSARPQSFSPHTAPSTKPVMEDVAEISLDTRVPTDDMARTGSSPSSTTYCGDKSEREQEEPKSVHHHLSVGGSRKSKGGFEEISVVEDDRFSSGRRKSWTERDLGS